MALTRTNIIGRITLPDDTNPVNSVVRFIMTGFDTDDTENATIIQIPIDATIDALGDIDVDLWPNPLGVRSTFYATYVRIPDGNTNDVINVYLGQISVPSTGGPYDLNDLLPIAPPAGATVSDYIAQLSAAVASTEANATTASDAAAAAVISAAQAALYDGVWLDNEAAVLADVVLTYTVSQPGTVAAGNYVQTKDERFSYIVAASGATDQQFTTAGGVKLRVPDKTVRVLAGVGKSRATNRTEALAAANDLSGMYGYAQQFGCDGGGGAGTIRWVTNGKDSVYAPPAGSFRAAFNAAVTGDIIVFDPAFFIRVNLVASIDTTGKDGLIIAAPGGNVEIAHAGDVSAFRLYSNNLILRGFKEKVLPKTVEGGTDRDFIDVNPDLCRLYWIDEITPANSADGGIDIATPTGTGVLTTPSYGTISRSVFRGIDKSALVRSSDAAFTDATMIYSTWYLCWFDHCAQRNPSIREQAQADVVNCFYGLQQKTQSGGGLGACYGADARTGGKISVRSSWFTALVGSGFEAVSVGDANGSASVSDCIAENGMTLNTAGTVTTPVYSIPIITPLVAGDDGREAFKDDVMRVAGAERFAGPDGEYTFDDASIQEPDGRSVRSLGGTGRFILSGKDESATTTEDANKLTLGTTNTNDGQLSAVIGDNIVTDDTSRNMLAIGRDHVIDDIGDQSITAGRGHNMATENGAAVGQFSVDDPDAIFRVGIGTSDGSRKTALSAHKTSGVVAMPYGFSMARGAIAVISAGVVAANGGYFAIDTEGAAATDDVTSFTFPAGTPDVMFFVVRAASSARDVVLKNGASLQIGSDITLDSSFDRVFLMKEGTVVYLISFSDNGV